MKKKVIFYFFKFSVLFFSVFLSCNEGYLGQDIQMEKLNDVGKAFMTHLLSNPDGKQQWEKLIRKGDIPPNEVALVFQGSRGWQYILPLLKDDLLNAAVSLLGLAGFAAYLVYLAILYKNYD